MSGKPIPDEVVAHVCDMMLTAAIGKDWRKRAPEAVTAFWMGEVREVLQEVVPALTAAQQQGQAVATVQLNPMRGKDDPHKIAYLDSDLPVGTKLYTAPPSAPVVDEAMTRRIMADFHANDPGDVWPPDEQGRLRRKALQDAINNVLATKQQDPTT